MKCTIPCLPELRRIRHLLEMIAPAPTAKCLKVNCDAAERIREAVARKFGLTVEQLCAPIRTEPIVWPRQVSMALCYDRTELSLEKVARFHGGFDHGTVRYARKRVSNRRDTEPAVRKILAELEAELIQTHEQTNPNPGRVPTRTQV